MRDSPAITHNWTAAFVAYCNGAPIDEIAQIFSIPLDVLNRKVRSDGWRGLRSKLPIGGSDNAQLPVAVEGKLAALQENRRKNLEIFVELRDHLLAAVKDLRSGNLLLEKLWCNKNGDVTRDTVALGPGDWLNLASYAKTIAEGTYRALGDFTAQGDRQLQDVQVGQAQAPAITIILPGVIAAPRDRRAIEDARGQVIDLTQAEIQTVPIKQTP